MSNAPRKVLAICLPQRQIVPCYHMASMFAMAIRLGQNACGFNNVAIVAKGSSMLPHLRCLIAEEALEKHQASHLLWVDDDHSVPEDTVERLMAHDRPIVGINASTRSHPIKSTARVSIDEMLYTTPTSTGLEQVYSMGFGLILIKREVFDALRKPYFRIQGDDKGNWIGEDAFFCAQARAAGFPLYVDHDLTKDTLHYGLVGFHSNHAAEAAGMMGFQTHEMKRTPNQALSAA